MKIKRGKGGIKKINIEKKNHRGQFYLIAAIIIIAVVVSVFTLSNYIPKKESVKLYDLGEELKIESQNVLDYGTYNQLSETEMEGLMTTFVGEYAMYSEEGKNLYFIFGNSKRIRVVAYQDLAESVSVSINGGAYQEMVIAEEEGGQFSKSGSISKVVIKIGDIEYQFELKPGENFYFIISEESGGEKNVVTKGD